MHFAREREAGRGGEGETGREMHLAREREAGRGGEGERERELFVTSSEGQGRADRVDQEFHTADHLHRERYRGGERSSPLSCLYFPPVTTPWSV